MNLQIELFTTPTVEGRKILSSKGFVCANVVLGAGVIEDEYKEKWTLPNYLDTDGVEPYHIELFNALENEVLSKGANAVIDLHMEHCYVNNGRALYNRRLLISAQGTAVVLDGTEMSKNNIKGNVLEQQILRKHILTKLKKWHEEYEKRKGDWYCDISAKEWEFICRYPDVSFADAMHLAYTGEVIDHGHKSYDYSFEREKYYRYFKYFKKLPYEKQIDLAYKYCNQQSSNLIVECDLFEAKPILAWAQKGEYEFATECLKARKKEYSRQDLEDMQELYEFFANLPTDKIEEMVPYNEDPCRRKYICKNCGHEFDVFKDEYYCPDFMCQKNNKGLTRKQEERIKDFGIKIETLKELLSGNK